MKILMVTSEAIPFAKSGGLGDAVSALSRALSRMGHDVRIVMPRYYSIDRTKLERLDGAMGVPVGESEEWTAVYRTKLPGSEVDVLFIDHEGYYGREGVYGDKATPDFPDNPQRFGLLARAAFQVCRKISWIPDIIQGNDWPGALSAVFLRHVERLKEFSNAASIFSIHNLGYQGIYPKEVFPFFQLSWDLFHSAGFEFYDRINMLKAALRAADSLATVSPTYAREIQTPSFGFGMDGILRSRSADLVGIINGVDSDDWNPAHDALIPARYSAEDLSGKAVCKAALQKAFGLPVRPEVPLIGMITRLADQKGVGELFGPGYGAAFGICRDMDVQFVILGSGERWCEEELRTLSSNLANFKAKIGYDEKIAHLIEAGSDFFLMPSRYEPCGLNQMYSLSYATLP
ncbi:MAG: glycogen/starch synthase, partial [Rectinemataceae bacterium]|nr:glycogen/starch synthase [Rectinemataceae bacterium]